jgi:hypothetical protein
LIFPIKSIDVEDYTGRLVDIQVANTNDFVAENVIVHNSWLESMSTKTPIIMPNNTMMSEFITEDTGWLCKSGGDPSLYTVIPNDNEVVRPLVDVNDLVKQMLAVYNNRDEAKRRAENAYTWIQTKMDWQSCIVPQWVKIFDESYADLKSGENKVIEQGENVIEAETF